MTRPVACLACLLSVFLLCIAAPATLQPVLEIPAQDGRAVHYAWQPAGKVERVLELFMR